MVGGNVLRERFEKRLWSKPVSYSAEIDDDGLILGAGTILARMTRDAFGAPVLAVQEDEDRLLALLAAAHGRPASPELQRHLESASDYWRRGEKALANIRLAYAALPRLVDHADAYRLFLAEKLLDDGVSPGTLMKGLGFEPAARDFIKYNPNQPRVPAGNGRNSGRWGSAGGAAQENSASTHTVAPAATQNAASAQALAPAAARAAGSAEISSAARGAGTLAQGLFEAVDSSAFLAGLGRLAATAGGPAVMLGAIFIPAPAGRVSEGRVPGEPDLLYSFDEPAGTLHLYHEGENGRETVADASLGAHGIFVDDEIGVPIARSVKGALVFDAASLPSEHADRAAEKSRDEPKLCPDPSPDKPHGAKERGWAYQEQISRLNNPQRPLKRGEAVSLFNPTENKMVAFDDCRESDGTMIEAKGPGFAKRLGDQFMVDMLWQDWERQAELQVGAAGSRRIQWFFAEPEAAEMAREWFGKDARFKDIEVIVVPAEML
jgi:hypothetical protein